MNEYGIAPAALNFFYYQTQYYLRLAKKALAKGNNHPSTTEFYKQMCVVSAKAKDEILVLWIKGVY